MIYYIIIFIVLAVICILSVLISIQYIRSKVTYLKEIDTIQLEHIPQGVAVSEKFFFVIYSNAIEKYNKETKKKLIRVEPTYITHLNGGVIRDNILYCPDNPLSKRNVIHMWNINTLRYDGEVDLYDLDARKVIVRPDIDDTLLNRPYYSNLELYEANSKSKQLVSRESNVLDKTKTYNGVIMSVDYYHGAWWVVFSYFQDLVQYTKLTSYDEEWNEMGSWTFSNKIFGNLLPYSISGCSWKDSVLYCTGMEREYTFEYGQLLSGFKKGYIYLFRAYESEDQLTYMGTINADIEGQGIAWDRYQKGVLYGIRKNLKQVAIMKLIKKIDYNKLK